MAKRYIRLNWQNAPSVATPINATNLNKMDKGIDDIDTALDNLEKSVVGQIVNDPTKINNAAVNYDIDQRVTTLTNNLAMLKNIQVNAKASKRVRLSFSGFFVCIVSVQGTTAAAWASYMLHGYGTGGNRYNIGKIGEGADISIAIDGQSFIIANALSTAYFVNILTLYGSPPVILQID